MAEFDKLWNYDEPGETEERFRLVLADLGAGNRADRAELLTQIARAQGLQGKFSEAHATLDEVAALLESGAGDTPAVRYLLERGRVFRSAGEKERSLPLFQEAWTFGQQAGQEEYGVDAAHMMAITLSERADRMAWNERALALAEASPKAGRWLGSLYNNMGWDYVESGDYGKALDLFERAVAFRRKQGVPGPLRIARWCVAKTRRLLGEYAVALAEQLELLWLAQEQGAPDGFIQEELGENLLALGRGEEARAHFARAYELLSQQAWLAESEPQRLERLRVLSES